MHYYHLHVSKHANVRAQLMKWRFWPQNYFLGYISNYCYYFSNSKDCPQRVLRRRTTVTAPSGSPSKWAMNYHFKNKPNATLKNGLWSNCLPPLTIGSSYSNCLCRASGRPFTKAARALPVKLLKATKQYFIIEIHNAGEPPDLFRSYK